jgi:hypothetical protein
VRWHHRTRTNFNRQKARKLSLKPGQKIDLLTNYILPIYNLMLNPPCDGVLKNLDDALRQEIKGILHLVSSTATGFFYAPKANGGLGVPRLEHIVKLRLHWKTSRKTKRG